MYIVGANLLIGLLIITFGVLIFKNIINGFPHVFQLSIFLVVILRQKPYLLTEILANWGMLGKDIIIMMLITIFVLIFGYTSTWRRYLLLNITMNETVDIFIDKYKGITVDYSKRFKELNEGSITIDFKNNQNKVIVIPGDNNKKRAVMKLKEVKDRKLRKGIIQNIKNEVGNKETNSKWCSYGLIYIFLGGYYILREIIFLIYF